MKTVTDMIDELRAQGPIDETECLTVEGPTPSLSLVRSVLLQLSGEEGWGSHRFTCSILERCGYHPEDGHSSRLVHATETARRILIRTPRTCADVEDMLAER